MELQAPGGPFCNVYQPVRQCGDFHSLWFFYAYGKQVQKFFSTLFYSFGLSLCVETFQLVTKVGSFDVDDLLLNTIGGVAGYVIFVICAAIRRQHDHKKKTKKNRR